MKIKDTYWEEAIVIVGVTVGLILLATIIFD